MPWRAANAARHRAKYSQTGIGHHRRTDTHASCQPPQGSAGISHANHWPRRPCQPDPSRIERDFSIEQAHRPDEYIEVEQVVECVKFMEKLAASAAKCDK